jgi:hypothetical protein
MSDAEKLWDLQLQFARHNFENHQALIRFSDTKAGAMITLYVFLAASALQVIKDAAVAVHVRPGTVAVASLVFVGSTAGLLVGFIVCVIAVQSVLRPRGARFYCDPKPGTDLFWQEHVIAHRTNAAYQAAVQTAQPELLLKNLTDQIFELAHISKEKMAYLQSGRKACWFGFWCWILSISSGVILLRLK